MTSLTGNTGWSIAKGSGFRVEVGYTEIVTSPARCGVFAKLLLAAYVLAAALLPLAHHDVLCHLKSTTHCTTCVVASSGETTGWALGFDSMSLPEAGRALMLSTASFDSALVRVGSGRSPPQA